MEGENQNQWGVVKINFLLEKGHVDVKPWLLNTKKNKIQSLWNVVF